MENKRFNPAKLDKLNNPERIKEFPIEFIIEKTGIVNPGVIVDIGAGTGFFSIPFAKKYNNCKIYACDISEIMIGWLKLNVIPNHSNIIPLKMDDSITGLDPNIGDLLFMVNLHHELANPEMMLDECKRLLKPGGKIAISDWKKQKSNHGPSQDIRYMPEQVKDQLISLSFSNVKIFNDFPNNFLVIAEKD